VARAAVAFATALVTLVPAPAQAAEISRAHHNVVVVVNQRDDSSQVRESAAIAEDPGPTVTNQNVAEARASCTDCRTVAVAIQVILIEGDVSDFEPSNAAVAMNAQCWQCAPFASARQVVVDVGRQVRLSSEARSEASAIDDDIAGVTNSGDGFADMAARLDQLTVDLVSVIDHDIERQGMDSRHGADHREVHDDA